MSQLPLLAILQDWSAGKLPQPEEIDRLCEWELADRDRALAFGISPADVRDAISQRARLFRATWAAISTKYEGMGDRSLSLATCWRLWLPLALDIAAAKDARNRPLVQGILGIQGTGKTTLAAIVRILLESLGYSTLTLSIDDFYKTYRDRLQLQAEDPRLVWRGPPGTHDIELGIELLDRIRQGRLPLHVPRFDKSAFGGQGDRALGEIIERNIAIVLFEGWFLGVRPCQESCFDTPPAPIVTPQEQQFARDCNRRLTAYLPLWSRIDRLLILLPENYRLSQQWRREAERRRRTQGQEGMSDAEIDEFVTYFWQALHPELFVQPLLNDRDRVHLVVEIDARHVPNRMIRPPLA